MSSRQVNTTDLLGRGDQNNPDFSLCLSGDEGGDLYLSLYKTELLTLDKNLQNPWYYTWERQGGFIKRQ